jgi:hypothetical protein
VSLSKDPKFVAKYCDACKHKRSPYGRAMGFGAKHKGFKGPPK